MSVIVRTPDGTIKLFCKGAVRVCVCVGGGAYECVGSVFI